MKNASIRTKLLVGFGCILLLLIGLNAFSLVNMRKTHDMVPDLYNGPHMDSVTSIALIMELARMDGALKGMMMDGGESAYDADYQTAWKDANAQAQLLKASCCLTGEQAAQLDSALSDMDRAYSGIKSSLFAGSPDAAQKILMEDFSQAEQLANAVGQKLASQANADADEFLKRSGAS